jgi:hypothetical protein
MELILMSIAGAMTLFVLPFVQFVQRARSVSPANPRNTETSALLAELVEALAPLGMPDVQQAARRSDGTGWLVRMRAATYDAVVSVRLPVINVAGVLLIHVVALRYVFLPIGTV